jgi:hypothetical protein
VGARWVARARWPTSLSAIDDRARRTRHCCSVMSKARSAGRKCRMTASYERSKAIGSEGEIAGERTRGMWGAICHPNVFGSPRRGTHAKRTTAKRPMTANFAHPSRWRPERRSRGVPAGSLCLKSSPNLGPRGLLAIGAIGLKRERCQWAHVAYGVLAMGRSKGSSQSRSSSNAGCMAGRNRSSASAPDRRLPILAPIIEIGQTLHSM